MQIFRLGAILGASGDPVSGGKGTPFQREVAYVSFALILILACSFTAAASEGDGQAEIGEIAYVELPGDYAIVRSISVTCQRIFPATDAYADTFYGRMVNTLHITTNPAVIRRGLGFREGDQVSREDLAAAVRKLRSYYFLHSDIEFSVNPVADSIDVVVQTRDIWTTRPLFEFRKSGRLLTWSAGLEEYNLFGGGKGLGFSVGHNETQPYYGGWYRDPQLFGQDLLLRLAAYSGDDLKLQNFDLVKPFNRAGVPWGVKLDLMGYKGSRTDYRGGLDGPEWHIDSWEVDAAFGPRIYFSGKSAWWLKPAVYLVHEQYTPPPSGSSDASLAENYSPLVDRDVRAIGLELHYMHERYSQRAGINSFYRREDFNLGSDFRLRAGYSSREYGGASDATFFRFRLVQGFPMGTHQFMMASAWGEALYGSGRFSDVRTRSNLWYYRNLSHRNTMAIHLLGHFGTEIIPQRMFTMGVETGLRGFEAFSFSGERVIVMNLENRYLLIDNLAGLVSVGLAGFVDGGLAWRAGTHEAARPRIAAGIGLRLLGSRTRGALVTRIDLGFPLTGHDHDSGPVLSIAAGQAF
jgi:Omp85 superfamily domain